MLLLSRPKDSLIRAFLDAEKHLPYSYPEKGRSLEEQPVAGYDNDLNIIELGQGDAVWLAAKEAVRYWKMFPGEWAYIEPDAPPIFKDETVAMVARVMGLWWLNSCRIVYVIDNEHQFGFAYGTLPGHVECGEELFIVEKDEAGRVRYRLRAFSRPRFWLARLAYPVARAYQRKFVRESKQSMFSYVQKHLS
jgi:uncharacterized protein (UPF0548 family)